MIDLEALWCYAYMKNMHVEVDDNFLCAKIEAYKFLAIKEREILDKEKNG